MRRELHLFDILSVLTCVWPLGTDRSVWPYLHVLILLLQLAPRANEWCTVHGWSGRYTACATRGTYDLKLGIRGSGRPHMYPPVDFPTSSDKWGII